MLATMACLAAAPTPALATATNPPPTARPASRHLAKPATSWTPSRTLGGIRAKVVTRSGALAVRDRPMSSSPRISSVKRGTHASVFCRTQRFGETFYQMHSGYGAAAFLKPASKVPDCSVMGVGVRLFSVGVYRSHEISATPRSVATIRTSTNYKSPTLWVRVPGMAGPEGISIESWYYPGHYLRHKNFSLRLESPFRESQSRAAQALFRGDSTFRERPVGGDHFHFQSWNYGDRYIRHYRGAVEVSDRNHRPGTPFDTDRTWFMYRL